MNKYICATTQLHCYTVQNQTQEMMLPISGLVSPHKSAYKQPDVESPSLRLHFQENVDGVKLANKIKHFYATSHQLDTWIHHFKISFQPISSALCLFHNVKGNLTLKVTKF